MTLFFLLVNKLKFLQILNNLKGESHFFLLSFTITLSWNQGGYFYGYFTSPNLDHLNQFIATDPILPFIQNISVKISNYLEIASVHG